jgi:hypothetical protein
MYIVLTSPCDFVAVPLRKGTVLGKQKGCNPFIKNGGEGAMKKIFAYSFFILCAVVLFNINPVSVATAQAEEFLIKGTHLVQGEVVSETDTEVVIKTKNGDQTFSKADVEKAVDYVRPVSSTQQVRRKGSFIRAVSEFITVNIRKFLAAVEPTHFKFLKWFEKTRFYRVLMNVPEFKKFKKDNYAGYVLAYYCIWVIILAIALRVLKELVILVLSLFGIELNRNKY